MIDSETEGLLKTSYSRLVLLLYTDTCFVEMPYCSHHVHCAIAPLDALTLDTGILSGTVQHMQPGQMHCSVSANTTDQPVMMLQERAKQAKQAAMQAELAELHAALHSKQATLQALQTSHMHAQVWQSCFVA